MDYNELPDLHNRRANIEIVSRDCKANNYPLIAWPEDGELLRINDLPQFLVANRRVKWLQCYPLTTFIVNSDRQLRRWIRTDFGYSIIQQSVTGETVVQQWQIRSL